MITQMMTEWLQHMSDAFTDVMYGLDNPEKYSLKELEL
jgi:hypothetical protein